MGKIGNENVAVLITHNFLDPSIVQRTKLTLDSNMHLAVKILNGEIVHSDGLCDGGECETARLPVYDFLLCVITWGL